MTKTPLFFFSAAALALLSGACDGQADTDYTGEPLAVVQGIVQSSVATPPDNLEAKLLWINSDASPDRYALQGVAIRGSFPANFTLDVLAPPREEAMMDLSGADGATANEVRVAVADIVALPSNADVTEEPTGPIGLSEHYVLAYVESDVSVGSYSETFLGGALEAGFHLMEVIDVDDPSCASTLFDCLRPAVGGLDTNVEIRIDLAANLDAPDWT